jgi:hypothetical protein
MFMLRSSLAWFYEETFRWGLLAPNRNHLRKIRLYVIEDHIGKPACRIDLLHKCLGKVLRVFGQLALNTGVIFFGI